MTGSGLRWQAITNGNNESNSNMYRYGDSYSVHGSEPK